MYKLKKITDFMFVFLFLIELSCQLILEDCGSMQPGLVLTVYYKPTCLSYQKYEPVVTDLANSVAAKGVPITIQKVNCDICDCNSMNVFEAPTTILRDNGAEVARQRGFMNCKTINSFLSKNLCNVNSELIPKNQNNTNVYGWKTYNIEQPLPAIPEIPTNVIPICELPKCQSACSLALTSGTCN